MIVINGDDNRVYEKRSNRVVISETENKNIDQNYTLLQINLQSVEDFIKAHKIIEKQVSPINEIVIINKGVDLNMLSYQYDYKFIKDNYLILTNIFFFLNLLISNFDKKLKFILSLEKKSHYKVHINNFNSSIINYLVSLKKDTNKNIFIVAHGGILHPTLFSNEVSQSELEMDEGGFVVIEAKENKLFYKYKFNSFEVFSYTLNTHSLN